MPDFLTEIIVREMLFCVQGFKSLMAAATLKIKIRNAFIIFPKPLMQCAVGRKANCIFALRFLPVVA